MDPDLFTDGTMTVTRAAAFSGVSKSKLYEFLRTGELVSVKRGGRRLIPKRALVGWLASGGSRFGEGER